MKKSMNTLEYLDGYGAFRLHNPENIHELYFPLCNEAGFMSSVTPILHGDIKTDQHHFVMAPVTVEDLHNTKSARNFWLYIHGRGPWSVSGNSSRQNSTRFTSEDRTERIIEAGPLWHKLIFNDHGQNLLCETTHFVPSCGDKVEIMCVSLFNYGNEAIRFTPTAAIPVFGRSAENIRDHRHVTSLVNRLKKLKHGICVKPEIQFDERGHRFNETLYYVVGSERDGSPPVGTIPSTHDFIGEAGSYEWPEAVVRNLSPSRFEKNDIDGMEYVGALRFKDCELNPGEKKEYILLTGICDDMKVIDEMLEKYGTLGSVAKAFKENRDYWAKLASKMSFGSGLENFSCWMRWVSLQPIFRKIYGCSFLPYHDYGKGGRGWRDLWQDCLSLILQDPSNVRQLLVDNYGGVRIDGTNATIIGAKPGEFIADRNNIARVWMDHGAWPYLTTRLYIDQSGDFKLLFEKQIYFKDALIFRASKKDEAWTPSEGLKLTSGDGTPYAGTLFEHLLVQHLTSFFNVGEHNIMRLEGADWNDTLDMARDRGESAAFTALYGSNLMGLAELIEKASHELKIESVAIFKELEELLDTLTGIPDYDSIPYKHTLLNTYLERVSKGLSGEVVEISVNDLARDLREKGQWIFDHLRKQEYITTQSNNSFYNGYYNNDGERVDGEFKDGIRMSLTAQVFTTMFGLASDEQVKASYLSCIKFLKDPVTGGYRLNTPLGPNKLNFGRGFAFAYGEKENGSTFSHMAVMYMNALYKRGFIKEAYDVFKSLYTLSNDTDNAGIYPGIPEYFNGSGKGLYPYLTGSASWLLMTVLTQMYGVRGEFGNLIMEPKLTSEQFDSKGKASVKTDFRGKEIVVKYINNEQLEYGHYVIEKVMMNGSPLDDCIIEGLSVKISKAKFDALSTDQVVFDVLLGCH